MTKYADAITAAASKHGLDPALVTADATHESYSASVGDIDPFAIGDGGLALGVMQVHRIAAQSVNLASEWDQLQTAIDAKDEATAVALGLDIGCAYLALMMDQFDDDEEWALAAYNQGPTVVRRARTYADAVLALKAQNG